MLYDGWFSSSTNSVGPPSPLGKAIPRPRASRRGGFCVVGMFVVDGDLTRLFRYAQNPPSPTGEGLLTLLLLSIDGKEIFAVCLKFYQTFRSFLKVWSTAVPPRWGRVAGECPTGEVVPKQKQVYMRMKNQRVLP